MAGPQLTGISGPGFVVYDAAFPNAFGPQIINSYTTLSISSYWRAMEFIANHLASFGRQISQGNTEIKHRLDRLIKRQPNNYQNAYNFWRTLFFTASHYGNGCAEIERDSQKNAIALHNILPEQIYPFRWLDDDGNCSTWYFVGGIKPHVVPFQDMLHFQGHISYDGLSALNPVYMLSQAFERSRGIDQYMSRFILKGSILRGSICIPQGVNPEQQKLIVETLKNRFSGPNADSDVIVLSDGAKLENNTLSPEQSQLIQQASYSTKQMAQITGVSPAFLFDNSDGKYVPAAEQDFVAIMRDLFRPILEQYEDELSLKLLTTTEQEAGVEIKFDPSDFIRGNVLTTSQVTIAQKTAGVISNNEARNILGFPASTDPEDDKLKTLGDTAPPQQDQKDNEPVAVKHSLESFTPLFADVAARVGQKTAKALENATTKHGKAIIPWGNVFAGQQNQFAAASVAPILETMGIDPQHSNLIGNRYELALKTHFAAISRGETAPAPDLQAIALDTVREQYEI